MPTVPRRPIIEAQFRPFKYGYIVHCGQHTCGAQLGRAVRPTRDGMPWGEWYMGAVQPEGDPYRDWLMLPPDNPEISAAFGFSRCEEDGQVIYGIITPRWKKDSLSGRTRLDEHGRAQTEVFCFLTDEKNGTGSRSADSPRWRYCHPQTSLSAGAKWGSNRLLQRMLAGSGTIGTWATRPRSPSLCRAKSGGNRQRRPPRHRSSHGMRGAHFFRAFSTVSLTSPSGRMSATPK